MAKVALPLVTIKSEDSVLQVTSSNDQSHSDDFKSMHPFINQLDLTTAAAGRSVQSWNGRRRPHTGPYIKKILANNY